MELGVSGVMTLAQTTGISLYPIGMWECGWEEHLDNGKSELPREGAGTWIRIRRTTGNGESSGLYSRLSKETAGSRAREIRFGTPCPSQDVVAIVP